MRGADAAGRPGLRKRAQFAMRMLSVGLACLALGPAYSFWAIEYSGKLSLVQTASPEIVSRGFDFGPLYLASGESSRFVMHASVPDGSGDIWRSRVELLDSSRQPVFREDGARFVGPYQFAPGEKVRVSREFKLAGESGYHFIRFSSPDAAYSANLSGSPVVELRVRQGVISGVGVWGPALGVFMLGVMLLWQTVSAISHLGDRAHGGSSLAATSADLARPAARRA